jgi:hypothetical protein
MSSRIQIRYAVFKAATMKTSARLLAFAALLLGAISLFAQSTNAPIDWDKAKQLYQREQRGEKLSPEEQAYLNKAKEARKGGGNRPKGAGNQRKAPESLKPLTDMTDRRQIRKRRRRPLWQRQQRTARSAQKIRRRGAGADQAARCRRQTVRQRQNRARFHQHVERHAGVLVLQTDRRQGRAQIRQAHHRGLRPGRPGHGAVGAGGRTARGRKP